MYVPDSGFSASRKLEPGLLIRVSRALWPSKLECDAHICLWSSWFRMDEGDLLPREQAL